MILRKKQPRFFDQELSIIGFGGAAISGEGGGYGFGSINEDSAQILLKNSFNAGINVFDTAPVYGFGLSEYRIGKAFKSVRDRVFIISKCGVTYDLNKRIRICNDPKIAKNMLESTLKTLDSDYIDLYMIHWPDDFNDIRYSLEILERAREAGQIRYIGLCNTNISDLTKAEEIVGKNGVDAVQCELNIFNRKAVKEIFPYLKEKEIPFFAWGTLDKGIISERVTINRSDYDSFDARSWAPWWKNSKEKTKREQKFKIIQEIKKYLLCLDDKNKDLSLLELAVLHNLSYTEVTSTLCGVRSLEQLDSLLDVDVDAVTAAASAAEKVVESKLLEVLEHTRGIVDKYVF